MMECESSSIVIVGNLFILQKYWKTAQIFNERQKSTIARFDD